MGPLDPCPLTMRGCGVYVTPLGGTEPNHAATCIVLKAANDRHKNPTPYHDEFRGPWSDTVRRVELVTTNVQGCRKTFLRPWANKRSFLRPWASM
ncbi:hypothetical protein TNCV_4232001 [Trichonephila clavipes]|nr:hypothetical protein TNCV_4232001 [Trichonephila clavipes]